MKFKIKTNLWSGIIMGILSVVLLILLPYQVRIPAYDSGAPSPRIIPGICIVIMLIFSIVLIIQSLVFKKEKIVEFDWEKEKPAILLILLLCIYVALILFVGFIAASTIVFCLILFYCGERKPFIYIFTILSAIGIFLLFKFVFTVSLPTGIFF
ncbi:MAG: tripartite tricarboxylate transporter TctB family protein [Pseudobutyrivibrio sp.]|nr:tripartite tricarboxylate transporter TctB family protein [Pseudobutyrivibrio sp.]MCF0185558.1 tripartite tricarboxylate transporter TctB family protein [Bacteroidaceae bacterium]